jgi:hypothetical protein
MTHTSPVRDCTLLSRNGTYHISGESGEWRYLYEEFCGRHTYYTFSRFHQKNPQKKVTRRLSGEKVYEKVREVRIEPHSLTPIDLGAFESFCGH